VISSLIGVLVVIAILGLVVYLLEAFLPMAEPFKMAIRIIAGIICLLLILQVLGIALPFPNLSK